MSLSKASPRKSTVRLCTRKKDDHSESITTTSPASGNAPSADPAEDRTDNEHLSGLHLWLVITAITLVLLLTILDASIVATVGRTVHEA